MPSAAALPGASVAGAALCAALVAAGCGSSSGTPGTVTAHTTGVASAAVSDPLSLLGAATAPAGWHRVRGGGSVLAYPPAWSPLAGDRGTVSAALRDHAGRYLGYLNITPRQGAEREATWASFRVQHNRAEGDRGVRLLAAVSRVRFASGPVACVQDSYATVTGARYVELACLIVGPRPAVVVGAAPPRLWGSQAPTIARAISAARL